MIGTREICVLGAGEKPVAGAVNVDIRELPTTDVVQDLNEDVWKLPVDGFDVVIAEHIAEHMDNRIAFLEKCRKITKPGGILVIEVPNWSHITAHSNLEHLTTWSRVIFDRAYTTAGKFEVERIVYRITNPFTWKSYYLTNEFIGRQLDRFTNLVSGLRFHLKVVK